MTFERKAKYSKTLTSILGVKEYENGEIQMVHFFNSQKVELTFPAIRFFIPLQNTPVFETKFFDFFFNFG
jgi:biotin synthase-like enzyme